MLRKGFVGVCILTSVLVLGARPAMAADPPNKVMINFCAYDGLTFNMMFSKTGVTFQEYVLTLKMNLEAFRFEPWTSPEDQALVQDLLKEVEKLEGEIKSSEELRTKPLHDFYANDQSASYPAAFQVLWEVEKKGLTVPFLAVGKAPGGHAGFQNLVANKDFLGTLGGLCYADFWLTARDEPWVTQSMIDLTAESHKILLFGSMPIHLTDAADDVEEQTVITADKLVQEVNAKANNMCCNTLRKCVTKPGYNCPVCNQTTMACCLGAQPC